MALAVALAMNVIWRVFGPKNESFPQAPARDDDYEEFDATQVTNDD
jgi:hypothetical protein